jgi:hypothetical protein
MGHRRPLTSRHRFPTRLHRGSCVRSKASQLREANDSVRRSGVQACGTSWSCGVRESVRGRRRALPSLRRWTARVEVLATDSPSRTISTPAGALSTAARRGVPSTTSVACRTATNAGSTGAGTERAALATTPAGDRRGPAHRLGLEPKEISARRAIALFARKAYVQATAASCSMSDLRQHPSERIVARRARPVRASPFVGDDIKVRRDKGARRHRRIQLPGHHRERLILAFRAHARR